MALRTAGTNANNTLNAFAVTGSSNAYPYIVSVSGNEIIPADVASLLNAIKDDQRNVVGGVPQALINAAYTQGGNSSLLIPNRGVLKVLPGDYICWDSSGWPILLSNVAINTSGQWTHT